MAGSTKTKSTLFKVTTIIYDRYDKYPMHYETVLGKLKGVHNIHLGSSLAQNTKKTVLWSAKNISRREQNPPSHLK